MYEMIKRYGTSLTGGLLVLVVGVGIGVMIVRKDAAAPGGNTYQAGWDAAKKRLIESGYVMALPAEVMNIAGQVVEVRTDSVMVKIRPIEPLADPALDVRTVRIDASTKLYRTIPKDAVVYQNEVQAYARLVQQSTGAPTPSAATSATPPQPFAQEVITFSDIKQGDQILVSAVQNIKDAATFVAATVVLQVDPSVVPAPPAM